MKPISGYKAEAPGTSYPMLPKGLYIAKISDAKVEGDEPDQQLVIRVDITEGEYTGYYTKRYKNDSQGGGRWEAKYKGDIRLQIPDERNTRRQHTEWDLNKFNKAMWAIEDSNDGYHWDWNEKGLKGKAVGINVRQGTFNGNPYTSIGRLESVKWIRDGKAKPMGDMAPRGDSQPTASVQGGFTPVEDEEIPF